MGQKGQSMADARTIILHNYEASPFSEKIRLALRLKNLAWSSVDIPPIMPKPDLMPLTGGYRRTPVMQIGADIYCDTAIILRTLETRYRVPSLDLPGHEGLSSMVASWTDGKWFQTSVGVIFGAHGEALPKEFIEDRQKMSGDRFNLEAMMAVAPMLRDQWRAQLMWVEERLSGGRGAGSGLYIIGTKPGLADVHAHMNIWFVKQHLPDFVDACFETAPLTAEWYRRLEEVEGQAPAEITASDALEIAKKAGPRLIAATTDYEQQEFRPGDQIAITADDYARDPIEGSLVHADAQSVILQRSDPDVETVHVHFPRAGYLVRKL